MSICYFDDCRKCEFIDLRCKHKDCKGICHAKDSDLHDGDWGAMFPSESDCTNRTDDEIMLTPYWMLNDFEKSVVHEICQKRKLKIIQVEL